MESSSPITSDLCSSITPFLFYQPKNTGNEGQPVKQTLSEAVILPEAGPPLCDALDAVAEDMGAIIKLAIQKTQELNMHVRDVQTRLIYRENEENIFVRITLNLEKTMDEHEKQIALMEAEMAAAEDDFFLARPQIDNLDRRNIFRAGFKRAWDLMVKWAAEAEGEADTR